MPSAARTSPNARKCSGSLLAMTPSKSNTTARTITRFQIANCKLQIADCRLRLLPLHLDALTGFDPDRQPVFLRRQRADVLGAEVAVRVVREVEVDLVQA